MKIGCWTSSTLLVTVLTTTPSIGNAQLSISPGRPDVLRCSENGDLFFKRDGRSYLNMDVRQEYRVAYHEDGSFIESIGHESRTNLCRNKSLQDLVNQGLAFNLVSGTTPDTGPVGERTSIRAGFPDAIVCSSDVVFYRMGPTTYKYKTIGYHGGTGVFEYNEIVFGWGGNEENYVSSKGSFADACKFKSLDTLYLEERAFNFVTSTQLDDIGLTSTSAGWPDIINCRYMVGSSHSVDLYMYPLRFDDRTGGGRWYATSSKDPKEDFYPAGVRFDSNGQYAEGNIENPFVENYAKACQGETIDSLFEKGQAWNLVTPTTNLDGAEYYFEYTVENFVFEDVTQEQIVTERLRASNAGRVKNCSNKATAMREYKVALSVTNEQQMQFSNSLTLGAELSISVGYSVSASATVNGLVASGSVEQTASFSAQTTFGVDTTTTEVRSMTSSETLDFSEANSVEVPPRSCIDFVATADVSPEPIDIPYTATARLKLLKDGPNGPQETDMAVLQEVVALVNEDTTQSYEAAIDLSTNTIVYAVDGVYSGVYASQGDLEVSDCELSLVCDECADGDDCGDSGVDDNGVDGSGTDDGEGAGGPGVRGRSDTNSDRLDASSSTKLTTAFKSYGLAVVSCLMFGNLF